MRRDFAGFEQAVLWLHVVIAVVLLGYLILGKNPGSDGWITVLMQQIPPIEFSSGALLPELTTPPRSGKSSAHPTHVMS
jgi:hypothetical protein